MYQESVKLGQIEKQKAAVKHGNLDMNLDISEY